MRKDEKYIKEILWKNFAEKSNFARFEYQMFSWSSKPDFITLEDNKFTYYEIKSEFDTFDRLERQFEWTKWFFTHYYLVLPKVKYDELYKKINWWFKYIELLRKINHIWGIILLEDLENWIIEPMKPSTEFKIEPMKLSLMLWKEEKKILIKEKMILFSHKTILFNWIEKTLWKYYAHELDYIFPTYFHNNESLNILNKFLPNRTKL